jgi:hypothetical protein
MATITEDYVSFEIAKLLKEKGFDVPCMGRYSVRSKEFHLDCTRLCNNGGLFECAAPTLQMAIKWLREIHNFHIWVEPNHDREGLYNAHVKVGWWSNNWGGVGYNTYEQACEAAIKYCLENLI